MAAIRTVTVSPAGLAFLNQPVGDRSFAETLTITNTGNVALTGGTFTFGTTTTDFARQGALQGAGGAGTCVAGAGLALGASCTYNVVFTPTSATTFTNTLTVAYTGATATGSPVALTGTGVAAGTGALSFTGATGGTLLTVFGVRTLVFTAGASTAVLNVTNTSTGPLDISATSFPINLTGRFSLASTTCSFTTSLAPGTSCTFSIAVTGTTIGAITFSITNNGTGTTNGDSTIALAVP